MPLVPYTIAQCRKDENAFNVSCHNYRCSNRLRLDVDALEAEHGPNYRLDLHANRMRCTSCGQKGAKVTCIPLITMHGMRG